MRGAVLGVVVAASVACVAQPREPWPPPDPDPQPDFDGWIGPQGDPLDGCRQDSECPGQVCARDRACYPADRIRFASLAWTVRGAEADATTCASMIDLYVKFVATDDESFGFAPVKCVNGLFNVDKLPTQYTRVELGVYGEAMQSAAIDSATGMAMIDLP